MFLLECSRFVAAVYGARDLADQARGMLESANALGSQHQATEREHSDADASLLEHVWLGLTQRVAPGSWLTSAVRRFDEVYADPAFPAVVPFDPQVTADRGRLGTLLTLVDEATASLAGAPDPVAESRLAIEQLRAQQESRFREFLLATQRHPGVALLRLQLVGQLVDDQRAAPAAASRPPGGVGRPALEVCEIGNWEWPDLVRQAAESPTSPPPPRIPGLVGRLLPLVDLVCFELETGAYTVSVPFHVRVSTDEARRRLDRTDEAFAFHISEEQLRTRFTEPWVDRREIVCGGLTFGPEHTRLEILADPNYSSQPFRDSADWQRAVKTPGVRDVTDEFVTHRLADIPEDETNVNDDAPIFIVHGRDDLRKTETARLIERCTDREAFILHELPNRGQTLIEKFERHVEGISFAVILMTADDLGGLSTSDLKSRARQNVVFEHGFFTGVLGRQRVAVLCDAGVERPSDIAGLVYIEFDSAGKWKYDLLKEIGAAGITVAPDRVV
jgi:hypothetical protein